MSERREVPLREKQLLFVRSGNCCAFPGCTQELVIEGSEGSAVVVGEIAHIVGQSRQGPRGEGPLSEEDRDRYPNLLLLCGTHHKTVDTEKRTYSVAVLQQMKRNHENKVAYHGGIHSPQKEVAFISETLHSTLLPVVRIPKYLFSVSARFTDAQRSEAISHIARTDKAVLIPFLLRDGRLYAFTSLREDASPFKALCADTDWERHSVSELIEDAEGKRRIVALLNSALRLQLGRRGVRYDAEHDRFYFPLFQGETGPKKVRYQGLNGRWDPRSVVWQPVNRRTNQVRNFWWHLAAGLRFHQMAPNQWCLSLRPERHVTEDGRIPLPPLQIGRKVTSVKARMFNDIYLSQVDFWRHFLSEGHPRFKLDFAGQDVLIEAKFLSLDVSWPGIPGDEKLFKNQVYEENLFTLADLMLPPETDDNLWDEEDDLEEDDDEEL